MPGSAAMPQPLPPFETMPYKTWRPSFTHNRGPPLSPLHESFPSSFWPAQNWKSSFTRLWYREEDSPLQYDEENTLTSVDKTTGDWLPASVWPQPATWQVEVGLSANGMMWVSVRFLMCIDPSCNEAAMIPVYWCQTDVDTDYKPILEDIPGRLYRHRTV